MTRLRISEWELACCGEAFVTDDEVDFEIVRCTADSSRPMRYVTGTVPLPNYARLKPVFDVRQPSPNVEVPPRPGADAINDPRSVQKS